MAGRRSPFLFATTFSRDAITVSTCPEALSMREPVDAIDSVDFSAFVAEPQPTSVKGRAHAATAMTIDVRVFWMFMSVSFGNGTSVSGIDRGWAYRICRQT